jgi:prevent-host-death family protein
MASASRTKFPLDHRRRENNMSDLRVYLDELLPIKEAARSLSQAVERLENRDAEQLIITRRSKPSAVILGVDRYEALLRSQKD